MSNSQSNFHQKRQQRAKQRGNRSRRTSGTHHKKEYKSDDKSSGASQSSSHTSHMLSSFFKDFVRGASSTVAAKFTSGLGSSDDKTPGGEKGQFDLYLLAQSWAPRFCCTNAKQCKNESMTGVDDLSVHGLWPAYATANKEGRTYPAFCSNDSDASLRGRAAHEWNKHGTCTPLSSKQYLDEESRVAEADALLDVRDLLATYSGEHVAIDEIYEEIGGAKRVALMASKFCQLQEITTCWSKNSDGTVGEQIDCPDHVLGSSRNSAILQGCTRLALDRADEKCAFISRELLRVLKSQNEE